MNKPTEDDASDVAAPYAARAMAIYRDNYAAIYEPLYITQWPHKHNLNAKNLAAVLQGLSAPMPDWLDLACGQAWHFALFQGRARMVVYDLSQAQLARARARVPYATFVHGDMVRASFPKASFDLVTNFWAGYCYLGSQEQIAAVLNKAVCWIRTGGALYMEVLLARDLDSFNRCHFSEQNGFSVKPRSQDYTEWQYDDVGGRHEMISPPLEFFLDLLAPEFNAIEAKHDSDFMVHLIATGRKHIP